MIKGSYKEENLNEIKNKWINWWKKRKTITYSQQ